MAGAIMNGANSINADRGLSFIHLIPTKNDNQISFWQPVASSDNRSD